MKTKEQLDAEYEQRLTVLKEQKKMHLITQDEYDSRHRKIVADIYGETEKEK